MLRDFGISEGQVFELLSESGWNGRCEPPWDVGELEKKIENSYEYGQNRPGVKSVTYEKIKLMAGRPAGGYKFTQAQIAELFHPRIVVDNTARLAEEETEGIPSVYPARPVANDTEAEDIFPAYLVGELDQIPDPTWLIRDVLPEMSLGMTYGETGSLKTFLELDKALWGAVGQPWAASDTHELDGFEAKRPLRTVIVAGEGARGLKRRIAAWGRRHEIETNDLSVLVIPVMPRFANERELEKLIRTIKAKLPDPDHVVVDTAMWAATGLNLNVPADSQVLLECFKRVMLTLGCSLTFVHHTGKDKSKEQLGAENLKASVDVVDRVDLVEKNKGRRKIRITNIKMKDGETRGPFYMEGLTEKLGEDEEGRPISSLVLRRCHGSANRGDEMEADPRLALALKIIAENKGKMSLSMNAFADAMAHLYATEELTAGELEKAKEGMRNYLKKAVKGELATYAHKAGKAKNAQWVFEDRRKGICFALGS